jgi:SRSO17 transposase
MIERAVQAGIPFSWVTADEAYGGSPKLRTWLEEQGIPYVMEVACDATVPTAAGSKRADDLAEYATITLLRLRGRLLPPDRAWPPPSRPRSSRRWSAAN